MKLIQLFQKIAPHQSVKTCQIILFDLNQLYFAIMGILSFEYNTRTFIKLPIWRLEKLQILLEINLHLINF